MTAETTLTDKQLAALQALAAARPLGLTESNKTDGRTIHHKIAAALVDLSVATRTGATIAINGAGLALLNKLSLTEGSDAPPAASQPSQRQGAGEEADPAAASPASSSDGSPRAVGAGEEAPAEASSPQDFGVGPVEDVSRFEWDDGDLVEGIDLTAGDLIVRAANAANLGEKIEIADDNNDWHELVGWFRAPDSDTVRLDYGPVDEIAQHDFHIDDLLVIRITTEDSDEPAHPSAPAPAGEGFPDFEGRRVISATASVTGSMRFVDRAYHMDEEVLLIARARVGRVTHDPKGGVKRIHVFVAQDEVYELTDEAVVLALELAGVIDGGSAALNIDELMTPRLLVDSAKERAADRHDERQGRKQLPLRQGGVPASVGQVLAGLADGLNRDELLARDEDGRRELDAIDECAALEAMAAAAAADGGGES